MLGQDAIFDAALRFVLRHEGVLSEDPDDPGGTTKYGISLRFARAAGDLDGDGHPDLDLDGDGDVDEHDIRALTPELAAKVYRLAFWDRYGYGRFPLPLAQRLFALAVNAGPIVAGKTLQRALRAAGKPVAEDGIIGPVTAAAALEVGAADLVPPFRAEAAGFYRELAARNPAARKWLNGWLNRAYA